MNKLENAKNFINGHKKLIVILITLVTSHFGIPNEVVEAVMVYLAGQSVVDSVKAAKS